MEELAAGLYEVLVTEGLQARLDALADALPTEQRALHAAEAPDRIAWHLSREIERALTDVGETDRARVGIEVARALLDRLGELVERRLLGAARRSGDGAARDPRPPPRRHARRRSPQPLIPLLDTTLLTNAPGEPTLWNQLRSEIESADAIDVVMAFIRRSGIAPLLDALAPPLRAGQPLRVLTTTYTGSTEQPGARPARRPRRRGPRLLRPRARPASTPRPGCSTGAPASRPPTSARRTSRTRRRSPGWSGTCGPRPPATPT